MAVKLPNLSFNGSSSVDKTFPFISTQGMGSLSSLCFANAQLDLKILWSPDGVNTDIIDATTISAGTAQNVNYNIKASYVSIELDLLVHAATTIRLDTFFFEALNQVLTLSNIGAGAQVLKGEDELRTLISSDASVTITQNANDINLTTASGGTKSYGAMSLDDYINSSVSAGTWYEINTTVNDSVLSEFTASAGRLTYTGSTTKNFHILCVTGINISTTDKYNIRIRKNGSAIGLPTDVLDNATGIRMPASVIWITSLATNDYISIYTRNDGGTTNIRFDNTQVTVIEI
jgi:hypothetical protein